MIKMLTWNVNGLRSCMGKGFMNFFNSTEFDILAIQETKMQREQGDFVFPGFLEYWNSAEKKGYSGTAVFTKQKPLDVSYGMGIEEHDREGRMVTLAFEKFYFVNVYTPNSQRGLARLEYRMRWEDDFLCYVKELGEKKPVVICGDLNVAHKEIDIKNARANVKNAGFTPEERAKMTALLESGFIDTFRYKYPDRADAYTWWSYMASARERNIGWRIDYFIVSGELSENIVDAFIYPQIHGSDHCPAGLALDT